MTENYQTVSDAAYALAVPEQVSIAMDQIAADMREGLLALAVGAGLKVMGQLMEADVTAECGPRGRHDSDRTSTRHGTEAGSVTLGGRRVPVRRPRVRAVDGTGEVPVASYELFNGTELLGKMAMEKMLGGLSTRRYPVGLEPVGHAVEETARSTSKSAVSRKFVTMTETALADLLAEDLTGLDLVALMIDGVYFAEHLCVVALGIDIDGHLAPLGIGRGVHGEHHRGQAAADRVARPRPGHHRSDSRGARRRQGTGGRRSRGLRQAGDRSLPTAQAAD